MTQPQYGGRGDFMEPDAVTLYVFGIASLEPTQTVVESEQGAGERVVPVMVEGTYFCKDNCGHPHVQQIALMLPVTLAANMHALMEIHAQQAGFGPAFTAQRDRAGAAIKAHLTGGSGT